MNEIQRYLAEEIAMDCSNGQMSRPEALWRLKRMGLSAAMTAALLSACGSDDAAAPAPSTDVAMNNATPPAPTDAPAAAPSTPAATPAAPAPAAPAEMAAATPPSAEGTDEDVPLDPAMPPPADDTAPSAMPPAAETPVMSAPPTGSETALATEEITFPGPAGVVLRGAFASAAQPRGAVLVIHENRGLNDHFRSVAGRLAAVGYSAIALDLLSEEGGTASQRDAMMDLTDAAGIPGRFVGDMRAALDELQRRVPGAPIGAIGFCFGGGMMWQLIASGDPRLVAVVPFYGTPPNNPNFNDSNAAVLAFYGALDARVNATQGTVETALTAAGLTHELVTFPGANHAFFNDTGMNYNQAAAEEAWTRLLAWFGEHLN